MRNAATIVLTSLLLACGCETPPTGDTDPAPTVAAGAPASAAQHELAALDDRTPVPLLPPMAAHQREQMRDHLAVVQEITAALARDDLDAAATSASRMGTSDSMTAMCSHMGAGAPGFTERALQMHQRADGIAEAARAGSRTATLAALSETLATCTSCHATYRQEIVDHARWTELTSRSSDTH
ncbi:MAG: cytochrome c [Myxococcota bacterium]|nr:cytochrome c [Myxococcota bacterium]